MVSEQETKNKAKANKLYFRRFIGMKELLTLIRILEINVTSSPQTGQVLGTFAA